MVSLPPTKDRGTRPRLPSASGDSYTVAIRFLPRTHGGLADPDRDGPVGFLSPRDDPNDGARCAGGKFMSWVALFIAGLFEVGWAVGLKYTHGFTRLWPTAGTIFAMAVSVGLLGWAMRSLPVGTAYAVWTGIGAVGTVLLGMALFGEPVTAARLACVALILAGIAGLKLTA